MNDMYTTDLCKESSKRYNIAAVLIPYNISYQVHFKPNYTQTQKSQYFSFCFDMFQQSVQQKGNGTHLCIILAQTVCEVPKGESQECIIFKYWTLMKLLSYLNYTHSLICNFKDV